MIKLRISINTAALGFQKPEVNRSKNTFREEIAVHPIKRKEQQNYLGT